MCYTLDIHFDTVNEKPAFQDRLEFVCAWVTATSWKQCHIREPRFDVSRVWCCEASGTATTGPTSLFSRCWALFYSCFLWNSGKSNFPLGTSPLFFSIIPGRFYIHRLGTSMLQKNENVLKWFRSRLIFNVTWVVCSCPLYKKNHCL